MCLQLEEGRRRALKIKGHRPAAIAPFISNNNLLVELVAMGTNKPLRERLRLEGKQMRCLGQKERNFKIRECMYGETYQGLKQLALDRFLEAPVKKM